MHRADENPTEERALAKQLERDLADVRFARHETDHVDIPAEANGTDGVVERALAADLKDVVDATPVCLRTPVRVRADREAGRKARTIFRTSSSQFSTSR
jgi:hypothetical protein